MKFNSDSFGPRIRWRQLPLLYLQGRWLRLRTRRLPEPPGDRQGLFAGDEPVLRLLVAGDSAALAVGVSEQSQGLSPKLAQALSESTGRAVAWQALGRSGLRAGDFLREREALLPATDAHVAYDLIVTSLGVNDAVVLSGGEVFLRDMRAIADILDARLATNGRLVFGRVPPLHRSSLFHEPLRSLVEWRTQRINALLAEIAEASPRWQLAGEPPGLGPDDFAGDGFHPNAGSYGRWATQLAADHLALPANPR